MTENNSNWSKPNGRPVKGTANDYVNSLLNTGDIFRPVSGILSRYNYSMSGVYCEKVLVFRDGTPFDAMCWLQVEQE